MSCRCRTVGVDGTWGLARVRCCGLACGVPALLLVARAHRTAPIFGPYVLVVLLCLLPRLLPIAGLSWRRVCGLGPLSCTLCRLGAVVWPR